MSQLINRAIESFPYIREWDNGSIHWASQWMKWLIDTCPGIKRNLGAGCWFRRLGKGIRKTEFLNWIQHRKGFRRWILLRIDGSHVSTLNSTPITTSTLELVKKFGKPNSLIESNLEKDFDVRIFLPNGYTIWEAEFSVECDVDVEIGIATSRPAILGGFGRLFWYSVARSFWSWMTSGFDPSRGL